MTNEDIQSYNAHLSPEEKTIGEILMHEININLPDAESKVRHGHPVRFLDGNPVVGYSKQKKGICLLFWSGQSFEEDGLSPEGKFKAAQIYYTHSDQIDTTDLSRWIDKSRTIQRDYKNIVKRKGVLEKLK